MEEKIKKLNEKWKEYLKEMRLKLLIQLHENTNDFLEKVVFTYASTNVESYNTYIGGTSYTFKRRYYIVTMKYKGKNISIFKKDSLMALPVSMWRIEEIFYELEVKEHEIKILHQLFNGFPFEKYI